MKAFFASKYGAMLKTFLKAFLAAAIVAASGLIQSGTFDLDMPTFAALAASGVVGVLAVLVTMIDPTDSRYGLGS